MIARGSSANIKAASGKSDEAINVVKIAIRWSIEGVIASIV